MKNTQIAKKPWYIFTTSVTESAGKESFLVELFEFSPEMECNVSPLKVLKGFDELIDFVEELETH
ncbi:hypothetical protein [Cytobacillus sp. NCCP-133]|uniref:hypothetical protein n=1 Tax=Cytobacillus sp. NCCP-133 TaxID=766848 RepID=UPI002231768A|nr:hypothetical protein [Cytobacillus sp. NCCP-133]GLB60783.1 hypothetical protein NCCP133_29150 [Cytobacillus sp. NCCP-133]